MSCRRRSLATVGALTMVLATAMPTRAGSSPPPTSTTWSGSQSGLWADAANWSAGIPTSALQAILPGGVTQLGISLPVAAQALELLVQAAGYSFSGGTGSSLGIDDNLIVDGSAASLLVNAVAAITTPTATVGFSSGSSGNLLTLSGSGVSLTVGPSGSGTLNVGSDGTLNQLKVTAASALNTVNLWVGGAASALSNSTIIEKLGTVVNATGNVVMGYGGSTNSLTVKESGSLTTPLLTLGLNAGANGNRVTVSGRDTGSTTNSQLTVTNELNVGDGGSSNLLEVLSNGTLSKSGGGDLNLGKGAGSSDNQLTVRGLLNQTGGTLNVGYAGDRNSLLVDGGGSLSTGQARIGRDAGADDNSVTVSGTGSSWSHTGTLRVGDKGSGNSLTISAGGAYSSSGSTLRIGSDVGSSNNTVRVTGAGSTLTMSGSGSDLVISPSTGSNNRLILSDGGYADVKAIKTGPGGILQFGEGAAPGSLVSSATITGNDGGAAFGGGAVVFDHNSGSFSFSNTLAGPLRVEQKGSGKTTLTGSHTYSGATQITGGTLALSSATNNISASPRIELSSGATFDVSGVTSGFGLASGQTLAGSGTVLGNLSALAGSTIAPGMGFGGIGTLSFQNDLALAGTLALDLNGTLSDQLTSASLQLGSGSTLAFTTINAPIGSALTLATYSSLSGSFSTVTGLPTGYLLDYAWQGNQIALVQVPAPLPLAGGLLGVSHLITLRKRLRRLQAGGSMAHL